MIVVVLDSTSLEDKNECIGGLLDTKKSSQGPLVTF